MNFPSAVLGLSAEMPEISAKVWYWSAFSAPPASFTSKSFATFACMRSAYDLTSASTSASASASFCWTSAATLPCASGLRLSAGMSLSFARISATLSAR